LRNRFHPLVGPRLFRELALLTCLFLSEETPSMGLHGPSSRLQSSPFDTMEFHFHRLSVLGVSTPSTACTALDLPDVFQPDATYRVLPSGVSTSRSAVPARRWPVPSRLCRPKPLPTVARLCHGPERCPQGLAPHENPSPDATVFSHCAGDDPLLGFSSSRFSALASRNRLGQLRRS